MHEVRRTVLRHGRQITQRSAKRSRTVPVRSGSSGNAFVNPADSRGRIFVKSLTKTFFVQSVRVALIVVFSALLDPERFTYRRVDLVSSRGAYVRSRIRKGVRSVCEALRASGDGLAGENRRAAAPEERGS